MRLQELVLAIGLGGVEDEREILGLQTVDKADETDLAFVDSDRFLEALLHTKAGAVLVRTPYIGRVPARTVAIVCDDPHLSMARASAFFANPPITTDGKEPLIGANSTVLGAVGQNSVIGKNSVIMSGAVVGSSVTIGDDTIVYPNVVIYDRTVVGSRVRIHAGAVIGSDGFGYAHTKEGEHIKIHHNGRVVIEDDVEIGANCTIDRAVFGETIIRRGTKMDNLVHIGHNCDIGAGTIFVAQVGVAGSTKLGRNCVIGGQSAFAGHVEIADFVTLAARSGVTKSITKSGVYSGFPAIDHRAWLRQQVAIAKLGKK
ncbi:UDP-3-O-acylglucosamine N-acyltransferase [Campylobacterota bacterium]|nr:UDP-3-O-acylglucosamine N-acyltransferase [Campylobacterota bacterium]